MRGAQGFLFGGADDACHGLDGLDRVGADAGLAGEHDGVGAVEDGVGDVGCFGAGRSGCADHGFEHLRGDDDGLGLVAAAFDGSFLHHGDVFEGEFDAEVASGDHDSVEDLDDVVEAFHGLWFLDFGDEGDGDALLVHDAVALFGVRGAADEGEGDHVGAVSEGPAQVVLVLLGEGGDADGDSGEVESLVVGDGSAEDDAGVDVGAGGFGAFQHDAAVVDEDAVAGSDVSGESFVGGGDAFGVSGDVFGGDGELVAVGEFDGAVGEGAEADFGSLEVGEDSDGAVGVLCGLPEVGEARVVVVVGSVAEVESGDVQACVDEAPEGVRARGGGA